MFVFKFKNSIILTWVLNLKDLAVCQDAPRKPTHVQNKNVFIVIFIGCLSETSLTQGA